MRTGWTIVAMLFFAGLALNITVPAVVFLGVIAVDWLGFRLARYAHQEADRERTAHGIQGEPA